MLKDIYKSKNGEEWVEQKACHPRKLGLTSKYIAPYWFQAFHNVFNYDKMRGLQEIHKLVDDSRIQKGLRLYKENHIVTWVVTKHHGGDVHAVVTSEKGDKSYTVIIKDYLPDKLPQYNYEREDFISKLFCDCTCPDHIMSHYRDNSAMLCKHIVAVLWFLMTDKRFNMPRIFIQPEVKMIGYQKSKTEELETNIQALPLIKFTQFINILLLNNYRGMSSALGVSIHKIDNATHRELDKPQWLTYCNLEDVEKLIKGIAKGYRAMAKSQKVPEKEIDAVLDKLIDRKPEPKPETKTKQKKKAWWKFW